jgi:hypothetical protein
MTSFENVVNGRTAFQFSYAMEIVVRVFKREDHTTYYNKPDLFEPIFTFFLTETDQSYSMRIASEQTGVRTMTPYSWRERVRADSP